MATKAKNKLRTKAVPQKAKTQPKKRSANKKLFEYITLEVILVICSGLLILSTGIFYFIATTHIEGL